MKLRIQKGKDPSQLTLKRWDIGFCGKVLDDRGTNSKKLLNDRCDIVVNIEYAPKEFTLTIDNIVIDVDDIEKYLSKYSNSTFLLDATTLGFVEILILSKNLKSAGLSFLYLEPKEYRKQSTESVLESRNFELSNEIIGFQAIPGHSALLTELIDHKVIFILGFESSRIEKAFEDNQMINKKNCALIFGFPAFKPGWEMDSFANHIKIISEHNLRGDIKFGAATDPLATYSIIKKISDSEQDETQLFVSPLGTKPMAIGCALFLSENPKAAVLYDHPIRKVGRSSLTEAWHLYEAEFETKPPSH
jgi:hypothetical protein